MSLMDSREKLRRARTLAVPLTGSIPESQFQDRTLSPKFQSTRDMSEVRRIIRG